MANEFAKFRLEVTDQFGWLRNEQVVVRTMLSIIIAIALSIVAKLFA